MTSLIGRVNGFLFLFKEEEQMANTAWLVGYDEDNGVYLVKTEVHI